MRFRGQIDAFEFTGSSTKEMRSYPEWFQEKCGDGEIQLCGNGMHIVDDEESGHFEPGDWIAISVSGNAVGTLFILDAEVIEKLFEKENLQ